MANVIVAFPKPEEAKSIKNILVRNGFQVTAVCTSGAQAVNYADGLMSGIIVCGYKFEDMLYDELYECLPKGFEMLLVASQNRLAVGIAENIMCLAMPLKVCDLINTLNMMMESHARRRKKERLIPKSRNTEEQLLVKQAKDLLMERNGMSEMEAHRYIQKCSMDTGRSMVESAQMIMSLNNI